MDPDDRMDVDADAAAWVVREDCGPLSASEIAERDAWLRASSRHFGAYARARAVMAWSDRVSKLPARRPAPVRAGRRWLVAVAATVVAALAATLWLAWPQGSVYHTARGEILRVALEDGSVITLDAGTRVRTSMYPDRRELRLLSGTALFDVASDPGRPFTVEANGTRVTAVGTRFSVSLDGWSGAGAGPVEVLVSEGVVDVSENGPAPVPARLHAGMRAVARPAAGIEVDLLQEVELDRRLLWREGMLAFNGDTLSVAAARFRRYSDVPIIIDDPSVGSLRIVGLYPANDPAGFARNVAVSLGLEVEHGRAGVRLKAPAAVDHMVDRKSQLQ